MPQAVAYAAYWAFNALVAVGLSEAAAIFVIDIGIKLAGLALLGNLSKRLIDIPDLTQTARNNLVTTRGTLEHKRIIYGEVLVSGPLQYMNAAGDHNQNLYHSVVVAGHEVEDITDMMLDTIAIPTAAIDWSGDGSVDSGDFRGTTSEPVVAYFEKNLGGSNQAASTMLQAAFAEITSQHQGRGNAYFVSRLDFLDGQTQVFSSGAPSTYKATVFGKKVYNPNSDSSQSWGTGPHRVDSSPTWEYSDNPALCWADYMIDADLGFGESASRIEYASVASVAAINSVVVFTPVGTDNRFRCNGTLSTGNVHEANLKSILSSANMTMSLVQGKWKLRGFEYETPVSSFGDDEARGDVQIRLGASEAERYNTVRGYFVDKDRLYNPMEFPAFTSSEYVARDNNETLYRDIQLPMTTDVYMAQRLAAGILEQSDLQKVVIYPSNFKTLPVEIGGTVAYSNSKMQWDSEVFRVTNYKLSDMQGIDLVMQEDNSAAYTDVGTSEYTVSSQGSYITTDPGVPAPTSLWLESVPNGLKVSWTPPAARLFDHVRVFTSVNTWVNRVKEAELSGHETILVGQAGTERNIWIRAVNYAGETSLRLPDSNVSTYSGVYGVAAIESPVEVYVDTSSWTFPSTNQIIFEGVWSNGYVSYIAPTNMNVDVRASWSARVLLSGGTSGVAVGTAFVRTYIDVDGTTEFTKDYDIEGYTNSVWATISGSKIISVPASEQIEMNFISGRDFSVGGSSPSQRHHYDNVNLSLVPVLKDLS